MIPVRTEWGPLAGPGKQCHKLFYANDLTSAQTAQSVAGCPPLSTIGRRGKRP